MRLKPGGERHLEGTTVIQRRLPKAEGGVVHAIGRRKESVARVYLREGQGRVWVNGRPADEYFSAFSFTEDYLNRHLFTPFYVTGTMGRFDVRARVEGGGVTGQLEALRLGIARALVGVAPEFKKPLKDAGLLTRDARAVERKKYGHRKARKKEQYSKR
ncbi:30S ribosomal protein S9 [Candidatus Bipolaricaulota bacterium]|nr:30S ribosomal protein S9 [Candidatus Bipolaricaulota bacterium]